MNRLKELREKNGYKSQQALADVLFVNQTAVSQWERGATLPSSQMLITLSKLFGESIEYILGSDNEKEKPTPIEGDGQVNPIKQGLLKKIDEMSDSELLALDEVIETIKKLRQ